MELTELLTPESIVSNLKVTSKKQVLQELSKRIAKIIDCDERFIVDVLLEREKLGTTGVGDGIAIPHGKLGSLKKLHGFFARLERPVDFDSVDERPVDLIFLLLAPESAGSDHLKALARISRLLRDKANCDKLRGSNNTEALYALLTESARSI
ncbi:MAG: PTS IIA-like nitrogen regulatory protein PtsN [Rhodospirillales bacterium]|jgi:PTS system nitrogen regulatory IIA component